MMPGKQLHKHDQSSEEPSHEKTSGGMRGVIVTIITSAVTIVLSVLAGTLTTINIVDSQMRQLHQDQIALINQNKEDIQRQVNDLNANVQSINSQMASVNTSMGVLERTFNIKPNLPLQVVSVFPAHSIRLGELADIMVSIYNPNLQPMKDPCSIYLVYDLQSGTDTFVTGSKKIKLEANQTTTIGFSWDTKLKNLIVGQHIVEVASKDCVQELNDGYTTIELLPPLPTQEITSLPTLTSTPMPSLISTPLSTLVPTKSP
jgi:hypothetical protein